MRQGKSVKDTYVMVTTEGRYIGTGNFTPEAARRYAINYMQQNGVSITWAKVEGTVQFIPGFDSTDGFGAAAVLEGEG